MHSTDLKWSLNCCKHTVYKPAAKETINEMSKTCSLVLNSVYRHWETNALLVLGCLDTQTCFLICFSKLKMSHMFLYTTLASETGSMCFTGYSMTKTFIAMHTCDEL